MIINKYLPSERKGEIYICWWLLLLLLAMLMMMDLEICNDDCCCNTFIMKAIDVDKHHNNEDVSILMISIYIIKETLAASLC